MQDPFDTSSSRLLAETLPGDNAAPVSVGELSQRLKRMVEGEFGHVRIRGEISGWKRAASGHAYLCLKDESAVIDGVIWRGSASSLPFAPQDGLDVVATGRLTTYPGRSKYQIVIERMELAGEGALMALFERLKAALAAEGLFAPERKRPIPYLPRTIGVVTSPTGAVIRDILHRLEDRFPSHVIVWPVKVQGEGAAQEVAAAVRGFDALPANGPVARPDLLIVARGGGSIEDLWAFNEEVVVRAIADCSIPVISAVGHETDTSLSDYAADLRAPTPTAAAEMAVPVRADLANTVATLSLRSERCARRYHERGCERLAALVRVLPRRDALLGPQRQRLDDLTARMSRGLERRLEASSGALHRCAGALRPALLGQRMSGERQRVDALAVRLTRAMETRIATGERALDRYGAALRPALLDQRLASARQRYDAAARLLVSVNPEAPLERGYAWVSARATKQVVATKDAARAAGALTLHFRDGEVEARVERAGTKTYSPPEQPSLL